MTTPNNIGALLLPWLKANAEEMARDLRDAGWEEDELGLWRIRGRRGAFHIFSAHEIMRHEATPARQSR